LMKTALRFICWIIQGQDICYSKIHRQKKKPTHTLNKVNWSIP
jgi:hypothetical protein